MESEVGHAAAQLELGGCGMVIIIYCEFLRYLLGLFGWYENLWTMGNSWVPKTVTACLARLAAIIELNLWTVTDETTPRGD